MAHVRRRHHSRESQELGCSAGPVSGAEPGDCCRRSQEAWRARLSLDDPGHQALPAGLRSATENGDIRPGAVRSDDGAIPGLGSQPVVVDVRIPRGITHINRGGASLRILEEAANDELARIQRGEQNDNKRKSPSASLERSWLALERWQGLYRRRLLSQRAYGSGSHPDERGLRNHFR